MKNKTTRFLSASIIIIFVLCVAMFSYLAYYMNRQSTESRNDLYDGDEREDFHTFQDNH